MYKLHVGTFTTQGTPHKGGAILSIMVHLGCSRALFVGDDETDEDVFQLDDARILGKRIGTNRESAARYHLRDQSGIGDLFDRIRGCIDGLPR